MLLKRFYYIICLILGAIRSSPALAGWETIQILDFGVIEVSGATTITMGTNGNLTSQSMVSHQGEHNGTVRYNNDSSSSIKVQMSRASNTQLTCIANCNSCSLTASSIKYNPQGNKTIQANSYMDWNLGASIIVSNANCQGVFEGTASLPTTVAGSSVIAPLGIKIVLGNIPTATITVNN